MLGASFFEAFIHIVAESAPYLLVGFAAAGLLRALIPEEKVYRLLGEDRFRSVFLASLFGVPLPLCSCSVIPAATGLRRSGAGRAATTSFLISTPETGVDSISITYALMDPIMTVTRPIAAFVTALVTGSAVALLPTDNEPDLPEAAEPEPSCCSDAGCASKSSKATPTTRQSIVEGLRYAFGPLLDDLAVWLLIGFVLAAGIATAVPEGLLAGIPSGWISSLLMMLVATPVYICASAATPIAAALVLKGLDPGAALVFLLVGPATNVTTILVVLRFMGGRVLAVYIAGVTVCALLFGVAVNALYGGLGIDPSAIVATVESGGVTALQAASAIVLSSILVYRFWLRMSGPRVRRRESGSSPV